MIKRLSEKIIFQTKLFTVKDVTLQLAGKSNLTVQIMEKADTALLVPIDANGNLILVREYFYAINAYQLGLPKGRVEKGSNPIDTASRELQEEAGYRANKIDELGILTMSPGYFTQKTHVFLARDLVKSKLAGDEFEELEVVLHPFAKFEDLIDSGDLTESRMIAALYLAKRFIDRE